MEKQLEYFLKNFSLFYSAGDYSVDYDSGISDVTIVKGVHESFWAEKKDIDCAEVAWKKWKNTDIPFLFAADNTKEILSYNGDKAVINYDIAASAFYFLSGWNEFVNQGKDKLGRVKYEDSIIKKLNINAIPVVNYYFDILREAIERISGKSIRINKWDGNKFAVCLTHDIDTCNSAWLEGSFSELKKKHSLSIPKLIIKRLFNNDDWFNFNSIIDIEKGYEASSTFYFLPRKGKDGRFKNSDYNIKSRSIRKVISSLSASKNEIGVHGSFGTHTSSAKLKEDIERIKCEEIIGNRFHFLMFDAGKSVSVLEESGIKYDTSLCFAEQIGFRRSTCFPFYLYDFAKDSISPVVEIPLIIMDATLADRKYLGISPQASVSLICSLIDEIRRFEGVLTVLWHNTFFSDYKYTGWKDVYISTLDYCEKNNGLLTTGRFIYEKIR